MHGKRCWPGFMSSRMLKHAFAFLHKEFALFCRRGAQPAVSPRSGDLGAFRLAFALFLTDFSSVFSYVAAIMSMQREAFMQTSTWHAGVL